MELEIQRQTWLAFTDYGVATTADEVLPFFHDSPFLRDAGLGEAARQLIFSGNRLEFGRVALNSYFASVACDFLRPKLMEQNNSFTLETVMSHDSKVALLAQAQAAGYRTYLYFVATDDPAINISRVRSRVNSSSGCEPNFFLRPSLAPVGRRKLAGGTCPP